MKYVGLYDNNKDIVTKDKLEAVEASIPTKTSQLNNDSGFITSAPVTSVNTKTGAVTLSASDVGAQPTITVNGIIKGDGSGNLSVQNTVAAELVDLPTVPTKVSELTNDAHYITASQAPVQSVNDKTGVVSLTASDVGAVSKTGDTMTGNLTVGSASLQTNGYVTGTWLKTTASIASSSAASKIAVINDGWIYSRTTEQIKSDIGLGNVDNVKQYSATNPPPYPVKSVNGKTGAVTVHEVPAVTTADNGKFLRVKNGEWASEAGGASVFLVTLTTSDYTSEYYDTSDITADKSFAEIYAAYQNDDIVRAKWGRWILDLVSINNDTATFAVCRGDAEIDTEVNSVTAVCTGDITSSWVIGSYKNTIPGAANILPKAPGTAAAGTFVSYSRCDHVHPKQTVTKSDVGLGNVDNVSVNARLNRTTNVNAADTNYTKLMARGESLNAAEVTPAVNGAIAWVYG